MSQTTPTPWFIKKLASRFFELTHNNYIIARVRGEHNAKLIAQAVHCHSHLVVACRHMEDYARLQLRDHPNREDAFVWKSIVDAMDRVDGRA